ncbi:TatD family hydrolase [Mangrovibacterium marinum]|uniref:TatD DNase family protein n=1 Tax=Mangrovibacterium marinum TaxID=1639118 RepID=A0A2T5BYG5_9BACT|nr:TatD family hydrolase [Mangrovibacterium marinum]PTN07274.1 TatD DNase family protein [Mangrovibacterium marinum]
MLIDTHSHIYTEEFLDDIDEVIQRAYENEVRKIVLPNIDSSTVRKMLDLSEQYPHICYPLMGLHPTSVNEDYEDELQLVEFWLQKQKFYGIGEVGIDLYWDKTFVTEQIDAFRRQIRMAIKYDLPLVIHFRESFNEVMQVLKEEQVPGLRGVFHSFSGSLEQAQQVIDLGFKLGVNGVVTFKNSGMDKVIENIDPCHLILETDAPYLTPVPFRGKRNESSYLIYVAQRVADLHRMSVTELAKLSTRNAEHLFQI